MYDRHEIIPETFLQNCVSKVKSRFNLGHVPGEIESVSSKDHSSFCSCSGGDDEYRDENEEACSVIPRYARRKVASQFREEYLDGRQSFIFSWDKKHRPIQEEAMRHYLDPVKKGSKFEYTPPRAFLRQEVRAIVPTFYFWLSYRKL